MNTKRQFKDMLKEHGLWSEFLSIREQLKSDGHNAKRAYQMAKSKITTEHLRQDRTPRRFEHANSEFMVSSKIFKDKPPIGHREVLQWVFDNIDDNTIQPEDAPSSGAWGLWCRVRMWHDLEREFYTSLWPRLLPTKAQIDKLEENKLDNGERQIELIDRWLKKLAEEEEAKKKAKNTL